MKPKGRLRVVQEPHRAGDEGHSLTRIRLICPDTGQATSLFGCMACRHLVDWMVLEDGRVAVVCKQPASTTDEGDLLH